MIVNKFGYQILIALFTNVTNGGELKEKLLSGDNEYEYAFVSAETVVSLEHILSAIHRSIYDTESGFKRTKNIHSEVVFCFSPNNNIVDALNRFGVNETTNTLYAIKLSKELDELKNCHQFLVNHIKGDEIKEIDDKQVESFTNQQVIQKNYNALLKGEDLVYAIIGSTALRGQ